MSERRGGGCTSILSLLLVLGLVISMVVYLSPALDLGNVRRTVYSERSAGVAGSGGEGYTFMQVSDGGRPVTWGCAARIDVEVNPEGAPQGYAELVASAVQRVNEASGFTFVVTGETEDREFQGRQRGPVLIGWADEEEVPELAGPTAGLGGASYVVGPGGDARSVGGMVVLDTDMPGGWLGGLDEETVLVHELVHVLGLGHSDDAGALMAAENSGQDEFTDADLAGLAALEEAACG
ncbi:matrixin family metalloprotease [uncultured Serinicoccus sp.]|uniref:matrixin family metalloprotease n=1 Tax=uncultured Serinicoccus sp. TaxID=735514 RepID=UPI00260E175C|nr:matrixin family metalloprotease [uncultured Serinicoccus sp.]